MGASFWWIFDVVTVIVLILCVFRCSRKGFSKMIVTAVGCIISLAAAWSISRGTAGFIYDNFFKKGNIEAVEIALEDYKPEETIKNIIESNELSGVLSTDTIKSILTGSNNLNMLYEYANSEASNILDTPENFKKNLINDFANAFAAQAGTGLPPYVAEEIINSISGHEKIFNATIEMLMTCPENMPKFVEEYYIRPSARMIVHSSVFLIVFFVLMTIILLVASKSPGFGLLNGYDRLDRFAGGLMGVIEGITIIMIIAVGIKIMINISENENSFISIKTVENTKIFRHFYKFL